MKILSCKFTIGTFALVASLAAPLAFAQSAEVSAQATTSTEAAAQTETSVQGTIAALPAKPATRASAALAATPASPATPAPPSATTSSSAGIAPAKKSWSDVDADKDGKLTKVEASSVPALINVFDHADGNADGSLTTAEYKTYVAQVKGGAKSTDGGK